MNARDQMELEYAGLFDGESRAGELCPSCHGGSAGEHSLSVSKREGLLLWQCHRASCDFSGASSSGGFKSSLPATKVPDNRGVVGRTILRSSDVVDPYVAELLATKYQLGRRHLGLHEIGWDRESDRLALPVKNFRGERLGVVLRALDNRKPKTLTHTEKDAIAWYTNRSKAGVIIVEDQLSAIRASDYLTSVALLGTHLNDQRVQEIRDSGCSPVYLALDRDAWSTAVRYAIRYRNELRPQLIQLERDLKDESNQRLSELLGGLK